MSCSNNSHQNTDDQTKDQSQQSDKDRRAKTLDDIEFNSEAEVSYKIERGIPVVSINKDTGQAIDIQESSGLDNNMIAFNVSGGVINIRVPSTSSNIEIRFKRHTKGLED